MAKVTVVIPCYNVEDKIERCLNSLMNQTYTDFTAILVDDGSTDSTASIIQQYTEKDLRFQYVYKENGGQASARNLGIQMTESELITFIDSDDYVKDQYLEKLAIPFENENVDMSACYFERIYQDKTSVNRFSENDLKLSKFPAVWAKMFRTNMIKYHQVSFPEGLWYEDLCFFTQLLKYMNHFVVIDQSLYCYIQNENSTMYTYSDKIFDIYQVFNILEKEKQDHDTFEYIMIYHILVGTVFRASFKPDFNSKTIQSIYEFVNQKYPKWYKNPYISKQMNLFYRTYLLFLRGKQFRILYMILKKFNKFVSL